jgi:hypothetical protein
MPSKELEVIDAEVMEVEPLSEGKARVLDKRIRQASTRVVDNYAALLALLEEADKGQIHVALGYASWTAWLSEAVQVTPPNAEERKKLVSLMSGKGVPQRAIAKVVGHNQSTISRDIDEIEGDADASTVTGADDKTYPKKKPKKKQEPLDVEEVEPPVKQQPVSQDFKDEMGFLGNSVSSFRDILIDERFPKARPTIAKHHSARLREFIAELNKVADELES